MRRLTLALAAGALSLAVGLPAAADKLPPLASKQNPPRYIDETILKFYLMHQGPRGYFFALETFVYGPISDSDSVRIDFIQKGKVLARKRCPLDGGGTIKCKYDEKALTASGPVTANLIYIDDQEDKEYLLRQLHVRIAVFPWMKEKHWQILHDDMLGTAFLWHQVEDQVYEGRGLNELVFYFWVTGNYKEEPHLRCTVDGKKVPDFKTTFSTVGSAGIDEDTHVKGKERNYVWNGWVLQPYRLFWGTEKELKEKRVIWDDKQLEEQKRNGYRFLYEMPGDWECHLRYQGKPIRQFSFHVNEKGTIDPSEAQSAPGFPMLPDGVVHVEMRLPRNSFDTRVRSDAIKKSMRYGMPWPRHPAIEEFKRSLPAPYGLPDP
jgi:hypothetical protein